MFTLSFYLCTIDNPEDENKLEIIYTTYLNGMLRVAQKYVGVYSAEEDVAHDTIMKIVENLDKINLDDVIATRSYVNIITRSCAIDWLRKEKKYVAEDIDELDFMVSSDDLPPFDQVMAKDGYEQLVRCIRSLKDTYRDVCELKFINGFKEREIAQILDISEKNVSVRIVRGRKMLIEMLKEEKRDD